MSQHLCIACSIAFLVGLFACGNPDAPRVTEHEPGTTETPAEIACKADGECQTGEVCTAGACLPRRCAVGVAAAKSIGRRGVLALREGLVAATSSTARLAGFSVSSGAIAVESDAPETTAAPTDLAGGHFHDERPDSVVIAHASSSSIEFAGPTPKSISLPFAPIAVAAGDVDGDGIDEAIAVSADGQVAICRHASGACTTFASGATGVIDAGAGDLDGNGTLDVVLLDSRAELVEVTVSTDGKSATHTTTVVTKGGTAPKLTRIAVGDTDDDRKAEILVVEDGGFFGADKLHLLATGADGYTLASSATLPSRAADVAIARLERGSAEVVALGKDGQSSIFGASGGALSTPSTSRLPGMTAVDRITGSDYRGTSATARAIGDGQLVEGSLMPVAALFPPPYSRTYSAGASSASLGATDFNGSSTGDTVVTNFSAFVGVQLNTPIGGGGVNFGKGWSSTVSTNLSQTVSISDSFTVQATPELDGYGAGAVMLSCTCYSKYDFEIEDPNHQLVAGAHGKMMSVYIPIGPRTQVVGLRRYAALAQKLPQELPPIKASFELGDPSSYPSSPTSFDGKPIAPDDELFPTAHALRVSDSVDVGFGLDLSTQESNSKASAFSTSVNAHGYVGVVSAGFDLSQTADHTEEVHVGKSTNFSGHVPPLRDDPRTPEDEFKAHAYSFTPVVYRHRFTRPDGSNSALYVLTYTVGP